MDIGDKIIYDGEKGEIVGIYEDAATIKIDGKVICRPIKDIRAVDKG